MSPKLKNSARRRALIRLATLRRVGSPIWAPHPENEPQCEAFESEADEILFGGAAGGGKSDLLIGKALTRHRKAVIFRRQEKDAKALVDRAGEIVGDFGDWVGKDRAYQTRDGREVEFGHCSRPGDERSWMGRPHDMKGFDELAHFVEQQYIFLSAWLRSTDPSQRCQVISASNPPTTAEGAWIIRRWGPWLDRRHPNPAESGELRWFATIDGKDTEVAGAEPFEHTGTNGKTETITPRSRTFIPATLDDNPYYRRSGYKAVLQALPEPLRSILLEGRFDAALEDDPWHVIPTAWVEAAQQRWQPVPPGPMSAAGVDVALGGRAQTVISRRHGDWFNELLTYSGAETPTGVAAAGLVAQALRDGAPAQVDTIGVGVACYEHLGNIGIPTAAMDARKATEAKDMSGQLGFVNQRSLWWWSMREALDPESELNLALPPDNELLADLCAPKWRPVPRGIQVELKEDIEQRLGRSIDKGDAVVMALPQMLPPGGKKNRRANRPQRANSGYQPHRWRQHA